MASADAFSALPFSSDQRTSAWGHDTAARGVNARPGGVLLRPCFVTITDSRYFMIARVSSAPRGVVGL